jgi:CheY-like chemotaxis protein
MATARNPITENGTRFLEDFPEVEEAYSRACSSLSPRLINGQTRISKPTDSNQSFLQDSASAKTESLPRIVIVSSNDALISELSRVLDPCPLEIRTLKSCLEAGKEIGSGATADVIFTDIQLSDGDWKQVLQMARKAPARAEVILVSRIVDVPLYLDALEAGAFDFVVPPFHTVELGYIIVNAIYTCSKQRSHRFSSNSPDATAA